MSVRIFTSRVNRRRNPTAVVVRVERRRRRRATYSQFVIMYYYYYCPVVVAVVVQYIKGPTGPSPLRALYDRGEKTKKTHRHNIIIYYCCRYII